MAQWRQQNANRLDQLQALAQALTKSTSNKTGETQ
jgi:hypothetical protein